MDSQLLKNLAGSAVRWLLVLIGGFLVKKGIITDAQSQTYVDQLLPVAIGAVMAGGALLWSFWQKKHANEKIDTALALPAGTDRAVLEKKVDQAA